MFNSYVKLLEGKPYNYGLSLVHTGAKPREGMGMRE
jgi:hypothetical protein